MSLLCMTVLSQFVFLFCACDGFITGTCGKGCNLSSVFEAEGLDAAEDLDLICLLLSFREGDFESSSVLESAA